MSALTEKLSKASTVQDWIDDFVHSKDERFKDKDNTKRIEMAIAAYYAAQQNESVDESIDDMHTQDYTPKNVSADEKAAKDAELLFFAFSDGTARVVGSADKVKKFIDSRSTVAESAQLGAIAIDVSAWTKVHGDNFVTNNFWIFSKKPKVDYGVDVAGIDFYVASDKYSAAVSGAAQWAATNGVNTLYLQNSSVSERRAYAIAQRVLGEAAEKYVQRRFHFIMKESNQTLSKISQDNSQL